MNDFALRRTVLISSTTLALVCLLTGSRDVAALPPDRVVG